jgi:hypothetical protein
MVEVSAPSETKEETSTTQPSEKNRDEGGISGPARTLSVNRLGQATLRKEQREQLESNHRENGAIVKESEGPTTDVTNTPLGREENGDAYRLFGTTMDVTNTTLRREENDDAYRLFLWRQQCGM